VDPLSEIASGFFDGKRVAVTGGTGSFGHFIIHALLDLNVAEVIVVSRDEEKQLDMKREISDSRLRFIIADVRDPDRMRECLCADYVYHAAALKIIPTGEEFPLESIKTNVLGTLNVKNACLENDIEKAVFISTDKAVKPVNSYGMAKALAERLWLDPRLGRTCFSVVRYGNVIGSRGSVIPFFKQLIKEGKPLPVTHKNMSRFLLTLEEAISLVFLATRDMKGGEIFIPRIPACSVQVLIEAMTGRSYPTKDIGIRPGEKIAETLISEEEMRRTVEKETHFVIHRFVGNTSSDVRQEYTSETARQLTVEEIRKILEKSN